MDHSFNIPGLGELQTEKAPTAPTLDSDKPTATTSLQASTDAAMTEGPRPGLQEQDKAAQSTDTVIDGAAKHVEGQASQNADTVMGGSEPTTLELNGGPLETAVTAQHDEEMEDHASIKPAPEASNGDTTAGPVTKEEPANTSAEEPQARSAQKEDDPAPDSPSVTHALEAALDGLLGPVPKSAEEQVDEEKPSSEAHVNGQAASTETAPDKSEGDANPEWEVDSSPYESSSSDSSSDSDDDDESDVDESKLLGVEETARLLMEADGGSDDEMDGTRAAKQAAGVRTKNELPDEPEPTPQVSLSPEDVIAPLGIVQHIVEGTQAVIEALQVGAAAVTVMDRGSVLCKEDRTVLGVIHDTIATVHKPMYILRFRSDEEAKAAGLERGTQVWYSKSHANFVFPSQLRQEKGSDASNLHDEEVGPDEMEYSDDEQEQAHKRERKNKKRGGKGKPNRGDDRGSQPPTMGDANLDYGEDDDGTYHKLPRPSNFCMGLPPPPPPGVSAFPGMNGGNRGGQNGGRRGDSRGRGRGRGFQGRGRGGGQGHNGRPQHPTQPQAQNPHQPPPPFPVIPPPAPGQWPFPVPPLPQFGGVPAGSSAAPAAPAPSYPMPSWSPAQGNPFPFPPVPPPNWSAPQQQRPAQQTSYMPPAGGYGVPGQYPPNNGPTPPAPAQNYQYPNYYGGQAQNNQQQRWG